MKTLSKHADLGISGIITLRRNLNDNDHLWSIESECEHIHLQSDSLQSDSCCEGWRIIGIDDSGGAFINAIIDGSKFQVVFSASDKETSLDLVLNWSCYFYRQSGPEGMLFVDRYANNIDIQWNITSDCSAIILQSTEFDLTSDYVLTIADIEYTGYTAINKIIRGPSFIATFSQNHGSSYGFCLSDDSYSYNYFNYDGEKNTLFNGFTVMWSCFVAPFEKQNGIALFN